jgi:hypothetical protein
MQIIEKVTMISTYEDRDQRDYTVEDGPNEGAAIVFSKDDFNAGDWPEVITVTIEGTDG